MTIRVFGRNFGINPQLFVEPCDPLVAESVGARCIDVDSSHRRQWVR